MIIGSVGYILPAVSIKFHISFTLLYNKQISTTPDLKIMHHIRLQELLKYFVKISDTKRPFSKYLDLL